MERGTLTSANQLVLATAPTFLCAKILKFGVIYVLVPRPLPTNHNGKHIFKMDVKQRGTRGRSADAEPDRSFGGQYLSDQHGGHSGRIFGYPA